MAHPRAAATARLLASLLTAALLASCTQNPPATAETSGLPPPRSVSPLDLKRLEGTWYEMGRIPADGEKLHTGGIVILAATGDGALAMSYRWRELSIDGASREASASIVAAPDQPGRLLLRRATAGLPPELWVLALSTDNAICALATPDRKIAMILNRRPSINAAAFGEVAHVLENQAYPVEKLQVTTQAPTAE